MYDSITLTDIQVFKVFVDYYPHPNMFSDLEQIQIQIHQYKHFACWIFKRNKTGWVYTVVGGLSGPQDDCSHCIH